MIRVPLIQAIHGSATPVVMVVTGGGSLAISDLLQVPGASRTVLEAQIPYAADALVEFLGSPLEQATSSTTARAMAVKAWQRGMHWMELAEAEAAAAQPTLLGIACTASLASDRPKRGDHRAHLAFQSARHTEAVSLHLTKGLRGRAEEERLVADLLLNGLAETIGIEPRIPSKLVESDQLVRSRVDAAPAWQRLFCGLTPVVLVQAKRSEDAQHSNRQVRGLIPGAFNPLHRGHRRIAQLASERIGEAVHFELSVVNVDKPPLDFVEIESRAAQFQPDDVLWLTRTPTFVQKAELFGNVTFVVGADTIARVADPKYYGASERECRRALEELRERGCRFLVFGRLQGTRFLTLSQLQLPNILRDICEEIPEREFRDDIASTQLRQA